MENDPKTRLEIVKLKSDMATSWVGVVGALVLGAIAVSNYVQDLAVREQEKVSNSIEYFKLFNSDHFIDSRQKIVSLTDGLHGGSFSYPSSDEARASVAHEMILVIDFFNSLKQCAEAMICSEEANVALLSGWATAFDHADKSMRFSDEVDLEDLVEGLRHYSASFH